FSREWLLIVMLRRGSWPAGGVLISICRRVTTPRVKRSGRAPQPSSSSPSSSKGALPAGGHVPHHQAEQLEGRFIVGKVAPRLETCGVACGGSRWRSWHGARRTLIRCTTRK